MEKKYKVLIIGIVASILAAIAVAEIPMIFVKKMVIGLPGTAANVFLSLFNLCFLIAAIFVFFAGLKITIDKLKEY